MAKHNKLGQRGEEIAKKYLEDKGYTILETNWRYGHWEIDIIAKRYDFLSIVEVKTRSTNYFGYPESFVGRKKMQNLINATDEYMRQKGMTTLGVRFEIVAITVSDNGFEVEHIEEAFNPTDTLDLSSSYDSY